jgi:hypothetical protein
VETEHSAKNSSSQLLDVAQSALRGGLRFMPSLRWAQRYFKSIISYCTVFKGVCRRIGRNREYGSSVAR